MISCLLQQLSVLVWRSLERYYLQNPDRLMLDVINANRKCTNSKLLLLPLWHYLANLTPSYLHFSYFLSNLMPQSCTARPGMAGLMLLWILISASEVRLFYLTSSPWKGALRWSCDNSFVEVCPSFWCTL